MYIKLDFESDKPIYEQLKEEIIEGIARGELESGESLPSVRNMAADIGINLHTVNKAYKQLQQEGFIVIHRQKGVVVNPDGIEEFDEEYKSSVSRELRPIIARSVCKGMDEKEFLELASTIFKEFKRS